MHTRRRGIRPAAAALAASLALAGLTGTAAVAHAAPAAAPLDYFADSIPGLRSGSVFEAVTYERFESLLNSDGDFALLIGGPEDAAVQAAAGHIDAVAQQYGVEKIYVFDPRLDGDAVDVRDSAIGPVAALWTNLTTNYLNKDTTPEFTGADDPYLIVYNRARTIESAEDRVVASLAGALDAEALDEQEEIDAYRAAVAAVFDSVAIEGRADTATQSQFEFFGPAVNNRHAAQYVNAEAYGGEILGAAQAENFVLRSITYPELVTLLNTPGDHTILFGGTWCHNTRAVIRDVNDKAVRAGVETVYVFDLRLDGTSGNVLHIRDSASELSYLYGQLADGPLAGIRTQYQVTSASASHKVTYYPGGDTAQALLTASKLQVPYLIEYNRDGAQPVQKDWIRDNGDGTFTEYMTEFWWVDDLPGNRNANRYPATPQGDEAWAAEQAKQWDFGDQALAALDVFFGLQTDDDGNGDGDGAGQGEDGSGDGSGGSDDGAGGPDGGEDGSGAGNGGSGEEQSATPSVSISGELRPGGEIVVTGAHLPADTSIRVELHSDPVLLGTGTTSASGALSLRTTIPASVTGASHHVIVFAGGQEIARTAVTLQAAPASGLPVTGAALPLAGVLLLALLLIGGGVGLQLRARRRERTQP